MNTLQLEFECEARAMIHRDGLETALDLLHQTDFYTAPASTRYHSAEEGGLAKHSLMVYKRSFDLLRGLDLVGVALKINSESLAIVSLFHDICKINTYAIDYRNAKNNETGKWEKVPYYTVSDDTGFGCHGAKSAFLLSRCMPLTDEEFIAILHHMGAWDKSLYSDPGKAYEKYPLAWLLHVADELATYGDKT